MFGTKCECGIGKEEYAYIWGVGRGSTGVELSGEKHLLNSTTLVVEGVGDT